MIRMGRTVYAAMTGFTLGVGSCAPEAPPPSPPPLGSEVGHDGVRLRVEADRAEMRTVDRLTLTATATAEAGRTLGEITAEPDDFWRERFRRSSPLSPGPEGGTVRTLTLILEPAHAERAPTPVLSVSSVGPEGQRSLRSEPLTVGVVSVLDPEDDLTLEPQRGLADAPPPSDPRPWPVVGILGGGLVMTAAGATVLISARRRARPGDDRRSRALAELNSIAASGSCGPAELASAEAAARLVLEATLGPRATAVTARELASQPLSSTAELAASDLLARFERARYAPVEPEAARELLVDAAALCAAGREDER